MAKKLQNFISLGFFLLGVLILYSLIRKVGWNSIWDVIERLNYEIILILVFPLSWYWIQSLAWHRVLRDDGDNVSLLHVFLAKICGEAINTITPISIAGGDPYRVYLLQKKASRTASTASVVIDRTMQTLAIVLLLMVSLIAAWLFLPLPDRWEFLLPLFTLVFLGVTLFLIDIQKKGVFNFLSRAAQKLGIQKERLQNLSEKIAILDGNINSFYTKDKKRFYRVLLYQFVGRFLGVVEIYLIARLLSIPLLFTHALFLTSLTVLINIVFVFIPGSMGVMEGSYGFLLHLLELNPAHGIAIQLIRRIRTIFWVLVGVVIMGFYKPKERQKEEGKGKREEGGV